MGARAPQVDPILLERAKRGDPEAHASLYRLLAPMVYTLARRILIAPCAAEDVLQETFVEVIGKITSYRGEAEFGSWVKRIAVNKCLMQLRCGWHARRIDGCVPDDLLVDAAGGTSGEDQLGLERALARLSPTARAVVWLHDVEGYTHREIGRLMGRTASFSKSQLARAHERLRASLEDTLESESQLCAPVLKTC